MGTLEQSVREVFALQSRISAIDDSEHDASIAVLREIADHPCGWHLVDRPQVLDTIADHHRAAGRPPGRNDACWCQSGRKYKHCCGPVPPEPNS